MRNEKATEIIVDLYEMRVATFNRYLDKNNMILDNFKYNFFTQAIAILCDKYKVTSVEIEDELYKRSFKTQN